jgi:hypothetical protein
MGTTRKLSPRIFLRDGRKLSTLDDVEKFINSLPEARRRGLPWQFAEALLLDATRNEASVQELSSHLQRVLTAEGMIRQAPP